MGCCLRFFAWCACAFRFLTPVFFSSFTSCSISLQRDRKSASGPAAPGCRAFSPMRLPRPCLPGLSHIHLGHPPSFSSFSQSRHPFVHRFFLNISLSPCVSRSILELPWHPVVTLTGCEWSVCWPPSSSPYVAVVGLCHFDLSSRKNLLFSCKKCRLQTASSC